MDDQVAERKRLKLKEPHMQPLVLYREDLLRRLPGRVIPHFDPEDGGVGAELLLLLSNVDGDPGAERNGSEFISTENDDPTATNLSAVIGELGFRRSSFLIWNVVPWQSRQAAKDADAGAMHLPRLVQVLPELRGIAVLSMDGRIRKAVERELVRVRGVDRLFTSNPGPQSYNQRSEQLTRELRDIALRLNLIR